MTCSAFHPIICKVLKRRIFWNSTSWWAASTVTTYCPSRPLQLTQENITKHGERVDENRCIIYSHKFPTVNIDRDFLASLSLVPSNSQVSSSGWYLKMGGIFYDSSLRISNACYLKPVDGVIFTLSAPTSD